MRKMEMTWDSNIVGMLDADYQYNEYVNNFGNFNPEDKG